MRSPDSPGAIRPAMATDLPTLSRLGALLVDTHHGFDPLSFIAATPQTPDGYASFLRTQLDRSDAVVLVTEREGEVIGYTYAGVEGFDWIALRGPAGVIYDILVDPEHRAHGVGRTLLETAVAALQARGAPRAILSTAEGNTAAQRLFAHAGLTPGRQGSSTGPDGCCVAQTI